MTPTRTPEGKWYLWEVSTGIRLERWPVDASPMVNGGAYVFAPPAGAAPSPAPVQAPRAVAPPADLPSEYTRGVPLVVTRQHEAAPSEPFQAPVRKAGRPRKRG
jgi:hypothetical protein